MNKNDYINQLQLASHPEGGWYRQVYKSDDLFFEATNDDNRHFYTSIYFLLDSHNHSHFHRLVHDEIWYFHDGVAITIHCFSPEGNYYQVKLGKNITKGEVFQFKVPKNTIFGSEVTATDSFALVSCMVSPGFDFRDFELISRKSLIKDFPSQSEIITRLTKS